MPSEDYTSTPSTGKLKLKGVKDSKIAKKGKKNKSSGKCDVKPATAGEKEENSVMLSKLEDEDREIEKEEGRRRSRPEGLMGDGEVEEGEGEDSGARHKTEAEKRYDEQRRKRVGLIRCLFQHIVANLHESMWSLAVSSLLRKLEPRTLTL
jgi:protein FAM32A